MIKQLTWSVIVAAVLCGMVNAHANLWFLTFG
jgi:hypothetical protein